MGSDVVMDVPRFINEGKMVDVLLVDEAHLLWSGNYGRVNKNQWKPDLIALHELARTLVVVYDPKQVISARSKVENNVDLFNLLNGLDTKTVYLDDQWRIQANQETQKWIKDLAHFEKIH